MDFKPSITVLGAGSWGTTLSILLSEKGFDVNLWEFDTVVADVLNKTRENTRFLPGIPIPSNILISSALEDVIKETDVIVVAVPSHVVRSVLKRVSDILLSEPLIVSVAKGIEFPSLNRMTEVIGQCLPNLKKMIGVLSGPSHAEEVSRKIPTAVVAAAQEQEIAKDIQQIFTTEYFRVYTNLDVIGVELGGALKNVMAIATGIVDGLGFGDNTKAALITRGLEEIRRLGIIKGAREDTFFGLSGLGDLVVTCTSKHSRNRHLGEAIGSGKSLKDALSEMVMVAEGVRTTQGAWTWANELEIELPIINEVYQVLYEGKNCLQAVKDLMMREPRSER